MKERGVKGLLHGNRGKAAWNKTGLEKIEQVVGLARGRYQGLNDTVITSYSIHYTKLYDVKAEMSTDAEKYMTDKTQFWVVRARVAAGEVSGLGTLLSGAYIGCNPVIEGKPVRNFTGLEKPPVVTAGLPGRHFVLKTESLGSLDVGSPVYYRGIKVGQVIA